MKITNEQLKQIIKEELENIMDELSSQDDNQQTEETEEQSSDDQ